MRMLAMNCGSSSIKAAVFSGTSALSRVLEARAEQLGTTSAKLTIAGNTVDLDEQLDIASAADHLLKSLHARLTGDEQPVAVVHRVVHGGEDFTQPTPIDEEVLRMLDAVSALAPLHNPPAVAVVRAARKVFASVPHFAVFDTAFHATLPPHAREYALPKNVRDEHGIRRFGFHGISHADVMVRVAEQCRSRAQALRIISCHLGNGASIAAIENGQCVDTSMGMTPLEGLVMGSRAGDLDAGIILELARTYERAALERLLSRESGLVGLTGTNDMRHIDERANQGDHDCELALSVYAHRIRKYIGAYAAVMGGVDAIAFTGGIGENSASVRRRALQRLDFLGARADEHRNERALCDAGRQCAEFSASDSRVKLFVVRADEERAMAQSVLPLLGANTSEAN